MKNEVDRAIHVNAVADVLVQKRELVRFDVGQVAFAARHQIVDCDHLVAFVQTAVAQVRAHKTCSACNHNAHDVSNSLFDAVNYT